MLSRTWFSWAPLKGYYIASQLVTLSFGLLKKLKRCPHFSLNLPQKNAIKLIISWSLVQIEWVIQWYESVFFFFNQNKSFQLLELLVATATEGKYTVCLEKCFSLYLIVHVRELKISRNRCVNRYQNLYLFFLFPFVPFLV